MYNRLHLYINFCWESFAEDSDNYLFELYSIVQFAYMHRLNVFYSSIRLENFINNCKDLDKDFVESSANKIDLILENANTLSEEINTFSIEFAHSSTQLKFRDDFIITKNHLNNKKALISFKDQKEKLNLIAVNSNEEFWKIDLHIIRNTDSLIEWIIANGERRVFNLSPKHGENGKDNWKGESVLICNRTTAQDFLRSAIGDFTKINRLFNFDQANHLFIEFFYEGDNPQNQWHGFHIDMDLTEKRVPESVRKYYIKKYDI